MDKLRCGVIGAGGMGRNHSQCIQQIEITELVALCDDNKESVEKAAADLGVDKVYRDYREMLDDSEIDAVTICTPHSLHGPVSIAALDAGKHAITEKPMAVTLAEADEMIEMAKRRKVYVGCSEEHRFSQQVELAKEWMDEGRLGPIFRCAYERGTGFRTAYLERHKPDVWRNKKELMGGGVYMDLGHHAVDTAMFLMGGITTCFARTANLFGGIEGEDTVAVLYKHENGSSSEIYIGPGAHGWHARVAGYEGEVKIEPLRGPGSVSLTGCATEEIKVTPPRNYAKCAALEKFFAAIVEGTPLEYPPEEARKVLAAVLATYESGEQGVSVEI